MKFLWCTLYVKDMAESLAFYQEVAGLSIDRRFPIDNGEIVFLGDGETKVELIYDGSDKWAAGKDGISLGFKAQSLDEKIALVKEKGIDIVAGPIQPSPVFKFFFVDDPNGVRIQFVEEI